VLREGRGTDADRTAQLAHQVGWPAWPVPRDPWTVMAPPQGSQPGRPGGVGVGQGSPGHGRPAARWTTRFTNHGAGRSWQHAILGVVSLGLWRQRLPVPSPPPLPH
jgi:hypothetical protein